MIVVAVRWYLRYGLSYRDVKELLAERSITVDRLSRALDELLPAACHVIERYANNPVEADHARLKARLRPTRGLKQLRSARVISTGHAFIQNLCRGHYELGIETDPRHRLPAAFTELALAI